MEEKHLRKSRAEPRSLSPVPTAGADAPRLRHPDCFLLLEKVRKGKMRHTPPEESYSRCLKWVRDPGGTTGHPEKLGPAAVLAPRPPHARPGRPRLREPSPRPASHSPPLTLARATEPGSGNPCGCRMPSGRARRGDQVPGYRWARQAAEDTQAARVRLLSSSR